MVKLTHGMLPVDPTVKDSAPYYWAHHNNKNLSAYRRNYCQSYICRQRNKHRRYHGSSPFGFSYRRDTESRAQRAAEYQMKQSLERKFLRYRTSYDGTITEWPTYGAGGYNYLYYVTEEIMPFYGRERSIDATLCGACVNKQDSGIVVLAIEHGDGYDDPIYCDDCGTLLAGYEEEENQ